MTAFIPQWSRHPKGFSRTRKPSRPLRVEQLEERALPAVTISVSDAAAIEGSAAMEFVDAFIGPQSGGLRNPRGIDYGPDGNLYVSGESDPSDPVQLGYVNRYDRTTGAFIDRF